tara:strand:+ start:115 stop:426 length:312 start_codon:yes stop_codon:yes gene_type:complete
MKKRKTHAVENLAGSLSSSSSSYSSSSSPPPPPPSTPGLRVLRRGWLFEEYVFTKFRLRAKKYKFSFSFSIDHHIYFISGHPRIPKADTTSSISRVLGFGVPF